MNKTQIEWAKNPDGTPGYTWNPITGCLNHSNGMCKGGNFPCYAYRLAHTRLKERYLANQNVGPLEQPPYPGIKMHSDIELLDPFYPRFWPERLELFRDKVSFGRSKPVGVFVCDMSDLFGIGVPWQWTKQILDVISVASQHRFYLLTKQPQNLAKFSPFPDNCWVGVTVTDNNQAAPAFDGLSNIDAKVKYLSFEPLLEGMGERNKVLISQEFMTWFDWLIIGAQTKPYKPPKIEWVREIVQAADKAGVPVFLKDNLKPLMGKLIRQEMHK